MITIINPKRERRRQLAREVVIAILIFAALILVLAWTGQGDLAMRL